ncbi:hypothetical protein CYLTODRAFT_452082 [Cylindrobasidium torrendii FP15055 ss-10]|uniref:Uncharacterized protein n=1 Tax=Cylindrobasidium torrendii FP15055 ss-10 TaxID=1314674 RepID=A0A0D7BHM2_9AGAR|nr:hypothetical protein CYLTODRAFT_452082 [Cylindrobasidium torrendii FP15055 ss-10]
MFATPPRPILKRAKSNHTPHAVHFPSSPLLTKTFDAPSYDRTPIVVVPNSCALPERGGRCYTFDLPAVPDLVPDESDESDDSATSTGSSSLLFKACAPGPATPPLDYAFSQPPEKKLKLKTKKSKSLSPPQIFADDLPFPPSPLTDKKRRRLEKCQALSMCERERAAAGGCLDGF